MVDRGLPTANSVKQIFKLMGNLADRFKSARGRRPFDAMDAPENPIN
jgi:hypothetical protein